MPVATNPIWDIRKRSIHSNNLNLTRSNFLGRKEFVQKLKLETTFDVHEGSVNTICWNGTGEYILSGSNDNNLVITNPFSRKVMATIKSKHGSNIYCARFMPQTNDHVILSSAADGKIFYTNIGQGSSVVTQYQYHCHIGAAYQLLTVSNDPHSFLSCGEDGTIRWFDVRVSPGCRQRNCKKDVLIDCRRAVTCMSLSPMDPFYLAVGCSDSSVRIYDRRMLGTISTGCHSGSGASGMCARFVPLHLINKSWRVTSLNYSQDGREVLASYDSDCVYLFDPKDDKAREFMAPSQDSRNEPKQAPFKRLRLRGDWSDTGPLSRPESEREQDDPRSNVSLMQRMSDIMSQWFEEASEAHIRALPQSDPRGTSPQPEGPSQTPGPSPQTSLDSQGWSEVADPSQPQPTASTSSHECPCLEEDTHPVSSPSTGCCSSSLSSQPADLDEQLPPVDPFNTLQLTHTEPPDTANRSVLSQGTGGLLPTSSEPVLSLHSSTEDTTSTIQLEFSHLWSSAGHAPGASHTPSSQPMTHTTAQSPRQPQPEGGALTHPNHSSSSQTDSSLHHMDSTRAPERPDASPAEGMDSSLGSSREEGLSGVRGQPGSQRDEDGEDGEDYPSNEALRSIWGQGFRSTLSDRMLRRSAAVRIQEIFRRRKERLELAESENRHIGKPSVKMAYKGHRNSRTMTKESCFWGEHFVLSGSDCGHIFIWDRHTGEHLMLLEADNHVVNCLQPHPYEPLLATSGIDSNIKIWSPMEEFPSFNRLLAEKVITRNELMLEETRNTITVPASFMLRMLASINHTFRADSENGERSEGSGQENEDDQ
ncbi:DDB1- and CUL4-associated factor 6 isoform X1 [Hypomesus transpacificus]|uniref:DDB1- and CUL4-associated factor 6 isoform X1 n=2 Tax=Hypomesus transpacificus TaxID=137520 RepID=UPI001F07645F|nr:DDB1- and CUL4-associated factor 6 isoform X1 [Hypomesus transpacificus]